MHIFAPKPEIIQPSRPKSTLSTRGDVYEQEADRLADQVTRMPKPQSSSLQAMPHSSHSLPKVDTPPMISETLGQAGQPLDASTRSFMEPRFGFDFSRVRIHSDIRAAESAAMVEARAFTVGNHIVFGTNQYTPGSHAGHSLLAHELTHVIQQSQPNSAAQGLIQRQRATPGQQDPSVSQLRQQYIQMACETIAEIRRGVEEGRIWTFENDMLLQGEEEVSDPESPLIRERWAALQELIGQLDAIIGELEAGTLSPSQPASRDSLRALYRQRYPPAQWVLSPGPAGDPARWSVPVGTGRGPRGELAPAFHSLGGYINNPPSSPPGMLRAMSFPTWWITGCQAAQEPTQPSVPDRHVTPEGLGLSRNIVIFIARNGSTITNWDAEPRSTSYPEAFRPFGPHEWHYDDSVGRVYIIVGGRQYNLLRYGRVEIQR